MLRTSGTFAVEVSEDIFILVRYETATANHDIFLDAFIRAFGGPYVLGQREGKLKLIKGSPHTPLTAKICKGHNVVYEIIHGVKPAEPGFNTLIFGLNLRRSGFHYHADTVPSLKAKNGV